MHIGRAHSITKISTCDSRRFRKTRRGQEGELRKIVGKGKCYNQFYSLNEK